MQTRKQVIARIKKNPGETLDDLMMLRQELITEKIVNAQLEKRLKIADFIVGRNLAKIDELRKQLNLSEAILTNRPI